MRDIRSERLTKEQKQKLHQMLQKPWTFCIQRFYDDETKEVYFVGQIKEWQGCITQGYTIDEVWKNLEEVLELCIETALLLGLEIPEPEE